MSKEIELRDTIEKLEFEVALHKKRREEAEAEVRVEKAKAKGELRKYRKMAIDGLLRVNAMVQAATSGEESTRAERILSNRVSVVLWDVMKDIDPEMYDRIMKDEEGNTKTSEMIFTLQDMDALKKKIFESIMDDRKSFPKKEQEIMAKQLLGPIVLGTDVK